MTIPLDDDYHLSPIQEGDEPALIEHLRDKAIHNATLRIPYPYTADEAATWVRTCQEKHAASGHAETFAVRGRDGRLVGTCGVHPHGHRAAMGYWLAREHRGRGLGTKVVAALVMLGFAHEAVLRLEATAFAWNRASGRVLEKNGFVYEGLLRAWHLKQGEPIDAAMYARVRDGLPPTPNPNQGTP